jgi:ATP-dependent DNA helicase RecQ
MMVAKLQGKDEKTVREQLLKVASYGIICYTPQNEEPQIVFRKARVATRDLQIDLKQYNQRREQFIQRVKTMSEYLKTTSCRSHFISHYFGDEEAKQCGICDACLAKKQKDFTAEEFASIASAIKLYLSQKAVTAEQLVTELFTIKKEKTWEVLRFLQAEKQIAADSKGILQNK